MSAWDNLAEKLSQEGRSLLIGDKVRIQSDSKEVPFRQSLMERRIHKLMEKLGRYPKKAYGHWKGEQTEIKEVIHLLRENLTYFNQLEQKMLRKGAEEKRENEKNA